MTVPVALTGTPGTGKTTVAERLADEYAVVHLNDAVERHGLWTERDPERGSLVADLEAIEAWLAGREVDVVESHLAHLLPAERVVVLRCHPSELVERLRGRGDGESTGGGRGAGESPVEANARREASIEENAESEALDVVLIEAVERHGRENVHEVDTTGRDPDAVAADVRAAIVGDRAPRVGTVDFTDYL